MLSKIMHKTRCKYMRKKEKERSIHGDDTNVLAKEFKPFIVKRFGTITSSLLIIGVNKLKSKSTIFNKLPNEVMSKIYVFSSRMLNRILRDVDCTGIVAVDGKMLYSFYSFYSFFPSIKQNLSHAWLLKPHVLAKLILIGIFSKY